MGVQTSGDDAEDGLPVDAQPGSAAASPAGGSKAPYTSRAQERMRQHARQMQQPEWLTDVPTDLGSNWWVDACLNKAIRARDRRSAHSSLSLTCLAAG